MSPGRGKLFIHESGGELGARHCETCSYHSGAPNALTHESSHNAFGRAVRRRAPSCLGRGPL